MELNDEAKRAVSELGDAINSAIERSPRVNDAINYLREIGYEPNLTLKLEIGLNEIVGNTATELDEFESGVELELTDEDLRTLRRMKIKLDSDE